MAPQKKIDPNDPLRTLQISATGCYELYTCSQFLFVKYARSFSILHRGLVPALWNSIPVIAQPGYIWWGWAVSGSR
jgi:hypothetical protein